MDILKDLSIMILFAKFFGLAARKFKMPQVAGEIIAGLIMGPSILNIVAKSDTLTVLAEIGVILLMFSAGLETDIEKLKRSGVKATVIACFGVAVPMVLGTLLFIGFYGTADLNRALFIGTILTATSVSITVQALKELGKLSTEVGTTIVSAAIIDDVVGILVLTMVISLKDPTVGPGLLALKVLLFFAFVGVVGYIIFLIMKRLESKYPHTRRIPILGFVLAFGLSYIADRYFGVADITGAYCAGVILSSLDDSEYIERKADINSYMIFGPVFFSSIGIQTNLKEIDTTILLFSLAFVLVGLVGKVLGCGLSAKMAGYKTSDCLKIGVGMMTRGEVALIVAQRGLKANLVESKFFTAVILLIIISSVLTPVLLKLLYTKDKRQRNDT